MPVTEEPDDPPQAAKSARLDEAPSLARGRRAVPRSVLAAALIGAGLVAGLAIAAVWAPGTQDTHRRRALCAVLHAGSGSGRGDRRGSIGSSDRRAGPARHRRSDLDGSAHATRIARGEVVEFTITAPIEGAASVHGLSDLVLMKAGERATLRFRAIYSGRFPLHFHGADGSHIGVWALDVAPTPS